MPILLARFSKSNAAAHLTDRAVHDAFVTAFAAAGVTLRMTEGRKPKPRVTALAPLAAGVTSECELLQASIEDALDVATVAGAVNAHLPDGLRIEALWTLTPAQTPPGPQQFAMAEYAISVPASVDEAALRDRVNAFLAAEQVPIPRRPAPDAPVVDAHAIVQALRVEERAGRTAILARLPVGGADSLHPRQLAAALGFTDTEAVRIHRTAFVSETPTEFRPFPLKRRVPDGR